MTTDLREVTWPLARGGEALETLARHARLPVKAAVLEPSPAGLVAAELSAWGHWLESAAAWLGVEAEPVETAYPEVESFLRRAGPALFQLDSAEGPRWLAVLRGGPRHLTALTSAGAVARIELDTVRKALCARHEERFQPDVRRLMDGAAIPTRRREAVRRQLLKQMLGGARIGPAWILRAPAGGAPHQVGSLARRVAALLGAHAAQYALWIASWWLLGWLTLSGRLEPALLWPWFLLLLTLVPLRLAVTFLAGRLAIDLGVYLRQRLLAGTLKVHPDEIRHLGVGHLLGRTLEVEAIETFAGTGAVYALTAAIELLAAALVLSLGAGGLPHVVLLVAWIAVLLVLGWIYLRRRASWTESRLDITNDLTEQMVGHQTRLVQERIAQGDEREDYALLRYLELSGSLDRLGVVLEAVVPRGWLLIALAGLLPTWMFGPPDALALGISLGGVLLAYGAFRALARGVEQLAGAVVAAHQLAFVLAAARRATRPGSPRSAADPSPERGEPRRPLLDVHGLRFRYPGRQEPVLRELDLRIYTGDRVLLEGPSGGGKSTLGSLLSASRTPESGLLLLDGLDPATLGEAAWRRRVVFVPQFHDNHVLIGTFGFNLLMGRGWPPSQLDLDEAETVCRRLALGPLLDRMPSGMMQMVGETGWRLSHGEKSRLFLARALLQNPELLILDETFAALDPETLREVMDFLFEREGALLAIAHP